VSTGPEHYVEAERLLRLSASLLEDQVPRGTEFRAAAFAHLAHAHAALAQAAAIAERDSVDIDYRRRAWEQAFEADVRDADLFEPGEGTKP
jgi:hypothetical protein